MIINRLQAIEAIKILEEAVEKINKKFGVKMAVESCYLLDRHTSFDLHHPVTGIEFRVTL